MRPAIAAVAFLGEGQAIVRHIALGLIVPAAMLGATCRLAVGEIFLLSNGGRVTGEWVNRDQSPRQNYVIKTTHGVRIMLEKSQVRQILRARPEELEYERIRPNFPDTVEGQWELAEWCGQRRLADHRKKHLMRVIELDPLHVPARRALGYTQIEGKWVTQEEIMIQRGYKRYKGRWRTPQEIELMETRRKIDLAEKDWAQKLRRWRKWLGTDRDADGRRNILASKDPHAVKALTRALQNDPSQHVRILYVEALANIGTPEAVEALAACSLEDPIEEVRLTCLDYLEKRPPDPDLTAYFLGKLSSSSNRVLNLAALGLGRLRDPSATGPLIEVLVTTHKITIPRGNPGSMSTTFGTGPGGSGAPAGLSVGGGTQTFYQTVRNQPVLDALVKITGQNFNFDQQAWKYWHAAHTKHPSLDARRD